MTRAFSNSFAVACVATAAVGGCQPAQEDREKSRAEFREAWAHRSPVGAADHPRSVIVAQGLAPLVFQVREPAVVHVMDVTTGRELVSVTADRDTLVYVSEDTGVTANASRVVAGPFVPGHRYAISVDVAQEDSWSSQIRTPSPLAAPSTQPRGH